MRADEDIRFLDCVPAKFPSNAGNYAYSDKDNDDEEPYQPKEARGPPRRCNESSDGDSSSGW